MRSMTGYGAGEAPLGQGRVVIEIRALNHRYLEVRTGVPGDLAGHAWLLEQALRKRFERGRYDVALRVSGATPLGRAFDLDRARAAYQALCALRDELAPGTDVPIAALAAIPDVFNARPSADDAIVADALRAALAAALDDLDQMRGREGDAMRTAIQASLELIRDCQRDIVARTGDAGVRQRDKLRARVAALLDGGDPQIDPARLELELAIVADRIDISEELARLDSHLCQLDDLLHAAEPVGRRIDFLMQEIAREVNTLSAKCQDAIVSQLAVTLKAEIARVRQQAQNIA